MPTIDEVLDQVAPARKAPPTADQLQRVLQHRRRRRRVAVAATGSLLLGGTLAGLLAGEGGGGQDIATDVGRPTVAPVAGVAEITGDADEASDDGEAAPPSVTRWFLVPPEPTELRSIDHGQLEYGEAQGATFNGLFVTSDPASPATAGLARVYHLEGIGLSITEGPEEVSETFHDVTVGDRVVRVGSDPQLHSAKAFLERGSGLIAVVGTYLTEDQAIDLVLAAELHDGKVTSGDDWPDAFTIAAAPPAAATDHRTTLGWGPDDHPVRLNAEVGTLEQATIDLRWSRPARPVTVRGATGIYVPVDEGRDPAALAWEENGYVFWLTADDDDSEVGVSQLVAIASSLQRVSQPDLVERFDVPFMRRQVDTVRSWFDATPLPPGWDPSPLIHGVPQGEIQISGYVYNYLECAWIAEWGDAVRGGDETRRRAAEATLADRAHWPVLVDRAAAHRRLSTGTADMVEAITRQAGAAQTEMSSITTAEQADDYEARAGCGFERPG